MFKLLSCVIIFVNNSSTDNNIYPSNLCNQTGIQQDKLLLLRSLDARKRAVLHLFKAQEIITSKDIEQFFNIKP
ncbi:MAG: hypothetical protein ACOYT8_01080 [Candidatus Dependentiae bacterium]